MFEALEIFSEVAYGPGQVGGGATLAAGPSQHRKSEALNSAKRQTVYGHGAGASQHAVALYRPEHQK